MQGKLAGYFSHSVSSLNSEVFMGPGKLNAGLYIRWTSNSILSRELGGGVLETAKLQHATETGEKGQPDGE